LKEGQERKRKKPTYRVTNCHEYNQSLKKRGKISLYFPDGDLLSQFIDASPYTRGVSGRTSSYRAPYVELIYVLSPFSWGMRQIAGYMQDYWKTLGLDIPVPSYGHLSDLFSKLDIAVKQRCKRGWPRLANGEDVTVIIDSTGLSFDRASQRYEEKYGKKAARKPWRKMHLAIDPGMNIYAIEIIRAVTCLIAKEWTGSCQRTSPLIGSSPTEPTTASSEEKRLAIAPSLP
jgi:hypothetical protein